MGTKVLIDTESQTNSENATTVVSMLMVVANKRAKSPSNSADKKKKGVFNHQWTVCFYHIFYILNLKFD